jgi:Holliday junction resolvase
VSDHGTLEKLVLSLLNDAGWFAWPSHSPRDLPAKPGMPDILAVRDGRLLAVEVKVLPDKLNAAQVSMIESLHRHGVRVLVVTRLQDVETFIEEHTKRGL